MSTLALERAAEYALAPAKAMLPREAREGLMRAWIAVLEARHPELAWLPAENQVTNSPVIDFLARTEQQNAKT